MRYDHHPDPATAFCIEVEELEAIRFNANHGLASERECEELRSRIAKAMSFRVGGDLGAIRAKEHLREIERRLDDRL